MWENLNDFDHSWCSLVSKSTNMLWTLYWNSHVLQLDMDAVKFSKVWFEYSAVSPPRADSSLTCLLTTNERLPPCSVTADFTFFFSLNDKPLSSNSTEQLSNTAMSGSRGRRVSHSWRFRQLLLKCGSNWQQKVSNETDQLENSGAGLVLVSKHIQQSIDTTRNSKVKVLTKYPKHALVQWLT